MPRLRLLWMALFALTLAIAVVTPGRGSAAVRDPGSIAGLHKLKHLIFIVQENRSFDHYFGTYPGADGIPRKLPCLPSHVVSESMLHALSKSSG
jgi:phospholipase C